MVTEASWDGWEKSDFTLYLETVLEAFGSARLVFGSDWPVATLAASYEEVVGIVDDFFSILSTAERDALFGGNAVALYGPEVLA
jgi:L-fuconolactonase